ncbi:UNVERIFIED_CONTAM: hypothetical protein RMT77_018269 [Armadillidium vulgare]
MSKTQIHSTWKLERCMVVLTLVLLSCLILPSAAIVKYPPRMVKQPLPNKELLFQVARGGGDAENEKPLNVRLKVHHLLSLFHCTRKNTLPLHWTTTNQNVGSIHKRIL